MSNLSPPRSPPEEVPNWPPLARHQPGRKLYIILHDSKYRYCIYSLPESQLDKDAAAGNPGSILSHLKNPIAKLDKATFPDFMSFAALGSKLYMVGGRPVDCSKELSDKVFIFDSLSSTVSPGPPMNSPKNRPFLFTVGSKIFALSRLIYSEDSDHPGLDPEPRFEVLDTDQLGPGQGQGGKWSPLPLPLLDIPDDSKEYGCFVKGCVAHNGSSMILISVKGAVGTYGFNLNKGAWKKVSDTQLPFSDQLKYDGRRYYYGHSDKRGRDQFCAFKIRFKGSKLMVDEIGVQFSTGSAGPLKVGPRTYQDPPKYVCSGNERMYVIQGGLDKPAATTPYDLSPVHRYVLLSARHISRIKHKGGVGKKPRTRKIGLSALWNRSYFAGPMTSVRMHVKSVFAM